MDLVIFLRIASRELLFATVSVIQMSWIKIGEMHDLYSNGLVFVRKFLRFGKGYTVLRLPITLSFVCLKFVAAHLNI